MEGLPDPPEPRPSFDRREMLRRTALAGGGLVWGVPLIQSIRVDPAAQGSQPPGSRCCQCACADANQNVVFPCLGPRTSTACQADCRAPGVCPPGFTFQNTVELDCSGVGLQAECSPATGGCICV